MPPPPRSTLICCPYLFINLTTSYLHIRSSLWFFFASEIIFIMLIILNIFYFFTIILDINVVKVIIFKIMLKIKLCKSIVENVTLLCVEISYIGNSFRTLHFLFQIPNSCSITERRDAWHLLYISLLVLGG